MKLDTVAARSRLEPRNAPYWERLAQGQHIGFRQGADGGTWFAKYRCPATGKRYQTGLGDFGHLPPGERYDAAKKEVQAWLTRLESGASPTDYTVSDVCREYVQDREREKGPANAKDAQYRFARTVYRHAIGKVKLSQLREKHFKEWRAALDMAPASRNRNLSTLKAALNFAVRSRYVNASRAIEWESVKPETVTTRRDLYLDRKQRAALVDALPAHARPFVRALCLLPLRPGALAQTTVADFDAKHAVLTIRHDKASAGRIVPLGAEVLALLKQEARGKLPAAPLIAYMDGSTWHKDRWQKPVTAAAAMAKLPAQTVLYTLRHSVITDMLTGGMDTLTVARIAGTSLEMIEKHYGHLLHKHAAAAMDRLAL